MKSERNGEAPAGAAGPETPSTPRAWLDRYGKPLTIVAVAVVIVVGAVLVWSFWRRVHADSARQELLSATALHGEAQVVALERMGRQYAGTEAAPEILYRLGCAYRRAENLNQADEVLRRLERDAPHTCWAQWATDVRRQIDVERSSRAAVAERVRTLQRDAASQRAFLDAPDGADTRGAALPAPERPAPTAEADPRACTDLDKP
jgi:hypothetical protein